jgi:hypothetical protein
MKLIDHVRNKHGIADPIIPEPQIFSKENKKQMMMVRDNNSKHQQIARLRELEEEAKKLTIEQYKEYHLQQLELEKKKMELENSRIEADLKMLELRKSIIESDKEKENKNVECCICLENEADTAAIPCGHRMFCYSCIEQYNNINHKCPFCRQEIVMISKIFM